MAKSLENNSPAGPYRVEHAGPHEMGRQLGEALAKGNVCLVCGKPDLDLLIESLEKMSGPKAKEFDDSLKQLREGAFGK